MSVQCLASVVTGPSALFLGNQVSAFAWVNLRSYGSVGGTARLFIHGSGTTSLQRLALGDVQTGVVSNNAFRWLVGSDNGSIGTWETPTNSAPVGVPTSVGGRYDFSTIATGDPSLFINGIPVAATLTASRPTGNVIADGAPFYMGNLPDGTRPMDGWLAYVTIWSRLLADSDFAALHQFGPKAVQGGLAILASMEGTGTLEAVTGSQLVLSSAVIDTVLVPYAPCPATGFVYPTVNVGVSVSPATSPTVVYVQPVQNALQVYALQGVTRDQNQNPLGLCDVLVFNALTNVLEASTRSDANGNYWVRLLTPGYKRVDAYLAGSPDAFGTTRRTLVRSPWAVGT